MTGLVDVMRLVNCNLKRDSKLGRSRRFDNKELVLKCIEDDPNISGKEI